MKYSILRYYKSFNCSEGIPVGTLVEDDKGISFVFTETSLDEVIRYDREANLKFIEASLIGIQNEVYKEQPKIEEYMNRYVNELKFEQILEID